VIILTDRLFEIVIKKQNRNFEDQDVHAIKMWCIKVLKKQRIWKEITNNIKYIRLKKTQIKNNNMRINKKSP
jgi:hypothetical protein